MESSINRPLPLPLPACLFPRGLCSGCGTLCSARWELCWAAPAAPALVLRLGPSCLADGFCSEGCTSPQRMLTAPCWDKAVSAVPDTACAAACKAAAVLQPGKPPLLLQPQLGSGARQPEACWGCQKSLRWPSSALWVRCGSRAVLAQPRSGNGAPGTARLCRAARAELAGSPSARSCGQARGIPLTVMQLQNALVWCQLFQCL